MDINATLDQSNKFCVEPTTINYYQRQKVKASRGWSWLSNMFCKLYIELARSYLLCINWSLHNRLVFNILGDLLIWEINSWKNIDNNCRLIPYGNWDHRYCNKLGLVIEIMNYELNTLSEPGPCGQFMKAL